MAPELLRHESANTTFTDVYSFGMILYEVFSRKEPYEGEDHIEVLQQIVDKRVKKRPPVPLHCPPQVQAMMTECLRDDPMCRPGFQELDERLKREHMEEMEPSHKHVIAKEKASGCVSLDNIFPKHIAVALKDGRTVEPEHHDCVTVFCCDIVGFTSMLSSLKPQKVANLLSRLYTKLDLLSQKHDVFKVETIGDAYVSSSWSLLL
jgi:serine/threonine protein kinase